MIVLGLNFYYHDSTACILIDGKLVAAIEEERLNRDKHTQAFPYLSIDKCLEIAGINYGDIDHIAISIKPSHNLDKKIKYYLGSKRRWGHYYRWEILRNKGKIKEFDGWYKKIYTKGVKEPEVHFIPHHLCHAPGTFFVSPYEKAAILGIDGSGEWATSWIGYGENNSIQKFGESFFPNSLGSLYEAVTQFCGFKPNYDEGKTMGLAPMGNPDTYFNEIASIVKVNKDGDIKIDLDLFQFQDFKWKNLLSEKFFTKFGKGRDKNGPFEQHHMDMAAAFQKVLEERVLEMCEILYEKTKAKYLVIGGGVSLNSVMNGRIVRESMFEDVYVMPAAGDNGTAIGAAYYLYNGILNKPRVFVHDNPYVGTSYTNEEIKKVLQGAKLKYVYHEDICEVAADLLAEGKIIGWFQGAMEIGPRALGNRSILANPAFPDMKDKINSEVKFREAYRPFAPSATVESYQDYFDLEVEAPFMLKVCPVKEDKKTVIPAVTHVDGSARLQTVRKEINPRYHELITALGKRTGVPVVLNTSFNIQGEPVVESPVHAIRCFYSNGLDALVLGNYLLTK